MESGLVSWQFEDFSSSAELSPLSPPVSPSQPPSPSLYNGSQVTTADPNGKVIAQPQPSTSIRAQLASSILNDLEQQESFKMEMNDFGMNWNEESVNLNLFEEIEELAEIENDPLEMPKIVSNAHFSIQLPQPMHNLNGTASESSADISALTAEFQAILDSLPKDNTEALSEVLEIAGIPTTIIDGEALVPVELDLTAYIAQNNMEEMDLDEMNTLDDMNDNDSDIIEESELYDLSNQGSPASSVYSSHYDTMISTTVVDEHSEAAQKILDALLVGDVNTAETYLPAIADTEDPDYSEEDNDSDSSMSSEDSFQLLPSTSRGRPAVAAANSVKPEQRGRKPAKKLAKGSPAYVKDKRLRKKEQNKTAATRYRQKKKMEFSIVLGTEAELQKENDDLIKQKDDLQREINMVKQLLRDVLQSKKPKTFKANPIVHGVGGLATTSHLIQRNRRK